MWVKVTTVENKFRAKDLIEVYTDKEELALRGSGLFALVCGRATQEECDENELLQGRRASWVFYKCIMEDEIHFVAEQYMTLAQRHEVDPNGEVIVTGSMVDNPEALESVKQMVNLPEVEGIIQEKA